MSVVVLSGGVGGAKFLSGLAQVVNQKEICVISNTGDDTLFYDLYVSPDMDIVTYMLAGIFNSQMGWGVKDETFHTMESLRTLGEDIWFNIGDRDMATSIYRTSLMKKGKSLSEVASMIAKQHGVQATILPMSDQRVETTILSPEGEIAFQEYMVKRRWQVEVKEIIFKGMEHAKPAPNVIENILNAEAVIIAPSNPFVSIGTILSVAGVREALKATKAKVAAISPIVAGTAIKGPAAAMLQNLNMEVSALSVCKLYSDFLDLFVVDISDISLKEQLEQTGIKTIFTDTMMVNDEVKKSLAATVLEELELI